MRIVTLEAFRKLPVGTLFMKYTPCVFEDLCAKGETWEQDWLYENITHSIGATDAGDLYEKCHAAEKENGASLNIDFDCAERDGLFEADQSFAVYETADIEGLIDKLNRCRALAYGVTGFGR